MGAVHGAQLASKTSARRCPRRESSILSPTAKYNGSMPWKNLEDRRRYHRKYGLQWIRQRRDKWIQENGPCCKCGSWEQLEIDHIDPNTKEISIAKIWSFSEARRLTELAKCQVLCERCHKLKTSDDLSRMKTKLTDMDVLSITTLRNEGLSWRSIAKRLNVHHSTVIRTMALR